LFFGLPLFLPASALFGQTLHFAPAYATPGENIAIEISLMSPKGMEPSTLQWQTTIPLAKVGPLEETTPGPTAKVAGKTVSCAVKSKTAGTYTTTCMLYGGQDSIKDGVCAILKLRIAPDVPPGAFRIRVDEALAVYKDLERVPIEPTETVVTVKAK
jgi:hypothetical protein